MFEGKLYDQIDDVPLRSPLGLILANSFEKHYEQKRLQSFEECKLVLCCGYIYVTICLLNSEADTDKFFAFLNQQNSNIKFTIEKDNFLTSFFRKNHYTILACTLII